MLYNGGVDFVNWLEAELNKREWSQSDLARKGKLTTAQVSRVLSRQSNPGLQFCKGVARAFDVTLVRIVVRYSTDGGLTLAAENDKI